MIQFITGDIFEQDVDVIVNPWNQNFIPWWLLIPQGVSGQIKNNPTNIDVKIVRYIRN